jgi:hypothetical protein
MITFLRARIHWTARNTAANCNNSKDVLRTPLERLGVDIAHRSAIYGFTKEMGKGRSR